MADSKDKKRDSDLLADARKAFERAETAEAKNRENWVDDVRFARLGEQWPAEVRKQRELEGRPCLTINRLPAFIRQVTNDARQNSPSIKFHPVGDGADEDTAKVLDGLVRNIEYTSNADVAYDTALDNAVTGGLGYFRITTDYAADDAFDQDIRIERIVNPLTVYGDPLSTCADSSDWNEAFITEMWSVDAFKKRWPDAEQANFDANSHDEATGWFSDDQIRVAEWWKREDVEAKLFKLSNGSVMFEESYLKIKDLLDVQGVTIVEERTTTTKRVTQRIITGAEILETNKWAGKYIPIVPVYGDEVVVDGERHFLSLVRFAKDPQRMMNYWRTTSTELVALAPKTPFIGAVGSFDTDAAKWATANTQTHAYIEYDPVQGGAPPQRQPFAGPPAGALQEAMNAQDDMKSIMGLFDASLGAQSNETSGRAILARQREGDVSTFNFTDNLSRAIRHAGRILADLIPKVYNVPRIIRVIHEDGSNTNVPVNQPTDAQPTNGPTKDQIEGITRMYDLTTGKYDVTCEAGPSFTTRREESASQMMEFTRVYPNAAPLIGDLLAKNLDWPGADEIAERLKIMLPPQLQGQNPQLEQAQQMLQQMQQALNQCQQQLAEAQQDKSLEARKLDIDAYKVETDRLKVVGAGMQPQDVQALVMQTLQQVLGSPDVLPAPEPPTPPQPEQPPQGGFFSPEQGEFPQ